MRREEIYRLISERRNYANEKNGNHDWLRKPFVGQTILSEETGEVARALIEEDELGLINELIDVAQVCVAWLEQLDNPHLFKV